MPKTRTSFQKGTAKGKPKGALNKTTKQARELLQTILYGQMDNIAAAFESLKEEPAKYLDACSKLFTYVLPKRTDVTSDDEAIGGPLFIFQDASGKTIDTEE